MTEQRAHWRFETDKNQVAWLTLDQQGSGTNTLGTEVMGQLDARLAEIERARPKALVIRSAKDSGFIAGADISEFTGFADAEQAYRLVRTGQQVFDRIEALSMPTAAAIQGFALGGGLELALACDYRVGADDGRLNLGLPEVLLGIHPGFGGTVRTPRLIGAPAALDLMLTGRSLRGDAALKLGLIDRLVPREALDTAAREIVLAAPPPKRAPLMLRLLGLPLLRSFVAAQTRKQVARRANPAHYPAPYAIINLFARHGALGAAAYEAEARSIAALFLERILAQPRPGVLPAEPPQGTRRKRRAQVQPRARRRCGRDGRGHRGLVRFARPDRDIAGPRDEVRRAGARARP